MHTDALGRRSRFARPQAIGQWTELRERDIAILQAIHRHGPLSTNYLFEFAAAFTTNFNEHQKRLTKLYNGTKRTAPYLIRPAQQFASFGARYQPLIYDLAPPALDILSDRGLLSRYVPQRTDPFIHRFMSACVGASLELAARERQIRYISTEEIFAHPKCPDATKMASNALVIRGTNPGAGTIIPDGLFGFRYREGGYAFFAVEVDRGSEPLRRSRQTASSFARKIDSYVDILSNRTYRSHWGLPNLRVLTVTTGARRARNLLDHLRQSANSVGGKFLFGTAPHFGANWAVPRDVLRNLLYEPWQTAHGGADIGLP